MKAFIAAGEPKYIIAVKKDINKMLQQKAGELKINKIVLVDTIFRNYFKQK